MEHMKEDFIFLGNIKKHYFNTYSYLRNTEVIELFVAFSIIM